MGAADSVRRKYLLDNRGNDLILVSAEGCMGRFITPVYTDGTTLSVVVDGHLERLDGSLVPEVR